MLLRNEDFMSNYHVDQSIEYVDKTRDILEELPDFFGTYFRAIAPRTEAKTRYNYAVDLRTFLFFLSQNNPLLKGKKISNITEKEFASLLADDIEEYLEYLSYYKDANGVIRNNTESGLSRKLSCLRSVYGYYVKKKHPISRYNPAAAVDMPKHHKKDIIYMNTEEIEDFITCVGNYEKILEEKNPHQLRYYLKTKYRDIAIIVLILGTGMRVSECAGININDLNFKENAVLVTRKGGKVQQLYFNDNVADALQDYIQIERNQLEEKAVDKAPLFYSMQKKRMTVRSIEKMVKKYAEEAVPLKHITVHKLRSSYGTELYDNSGDLYLTAEALGHESMNTTKHYANMSQKRRMSARKYINHRTDV